MVTLSYRNAAYRGKHGMVVDQTGNALVVRWPAPTRTARLTVVGGNLCSAAICITSAGGRLLIAARQATGSTATTMGCLGAWCLFHMATAAFVLWAAHRWSKLTQMVKVTSRTVSIVRLGWWSPRTSDQSRSDVVGVACDPIRRLFRSTVTDVTRLTIRFANGQSWTAFFHDSQLAAMNLVRDQLL